MWVLYLEMELEMLVFLAGGKLEYPDKKTLEQGESQQQTQPTYYTRSESNPGSFGGRQAVALSPLC